MIPVALGVSPLPGRKVSLGWLWMDGIHRFIMKLRVGNKRMLPSVWTKSSVSFPNRTVSEGEEETVFDQLPGF